MELRWTHDASRDVRGRGNLFKAGFAGGPVTDWHFYDTIYTERYIGIPPKDEESYENPLPIKHAASLKGKLLIAHGTGDDNVHFSNTLSLIDQLIKRREIRRSYAVPWQRPWGQRPASQARINESCDSVLSG